MSVAKFLTKGLKQNLSRLRKIVCPVHCRLGALTTLVTRSCSMNLRISSLQRILNLSVNGSLQSTENFRSTARFQARNLIFSYYVLRLQIQYNRYVDNRYLIHREQFRDSHAAKSFVHPFPLVGTRKKMKVVSRSYYTFQSYQKK